MLLLAGLLSAHFFWVVGPQIPYVVPVRLCKILGVGSVLLEARSLYGNLSECPGVPVTTWCTAWTVSRSRVPSGGHPTSVQFSSVSQSRGTERVGLPVHCQIPELAQTHVHRVGDTIQSSHEESIMNHLMKTNSIILMKWTTSLIQNTCLFMKK